MPIIFKNLGKDVLYFDRVELVSNFTTNKGISKNKRQNPFRNWSVIQINFSSGDFHLGNNEFTYTDLEGEKAILYDNGYKNYKEMMKESIKYIPKPKKILVAGGSAKGVGALTDEVIKMFPDCSNVTCCVDGFFLLYDWAKTAKYVWRTPKEILENIKTDNIVMDCLQDLHAKYDKQVKYLFTCSIRDGELSKYQN